MFSFIHTGSLSSKVTYLFGTKFLKIVNTSFKKELENQHFCYRVVYPSSLILELFVFSKHQPFCSSKVSVDKEYTTLKDYRLHIKIKSTMYDLMVTTRI